MRSSLTLAIALVCGALLPACSDEPTSPQPAPALGPVLRTVRNPDGPGAFVIRFDGVLGFLFDDPGSDLRVIAGVTLDQLAALCSGGDFTLEPATGQVVFRPDGSIHQLFKAKGVTLLVFEQAFADFCAVPPFAVGRGNFINTDNDLLVSLNRTNSFGFRLRGRVTDASGGQSHLVAMFHAIINRCGELRVLTSAIKLH